MSDINRILIAVILIGLLFALYKYQDIILENLDCLQSSVQSSVSSLNVLPLQDNPKIQQNVPNLQITNKKEDKITADNISQISILSLDNKNNFDMSSLENSDNMSMFDDNTCDTRMSKQTYGSLFDD